MSDMAEDGCQSHADWKEGGMVTSEGRMVTGKAHENGRRQPITGSKGSSFSIYISIKTPQ